MGSFPSHSPSSSIQLPQQQQYQGKSRNGIYEQKQQNKTSNGNFTKNIPLIETTPTPYDNNQQENTRPPTTQQQQEESKLGFPPQKTTPPLDSARSRTSHRSVKDTATNSNFAAADENNGSDCSEASSSLLPEHTFQLFPAFSLGTNSRYSPHMSSLPVLPLPNISSLPISFRPTEIEFSKKNKRSFSLDDRSEEQQQQQPQTKQSHLHTSTTTARRKASIVPVSDNNNLLPPDLSILVSTPDEMNSAAGNNCSNNTTTTTLEIPAIQNAISNSQSTTTESSSSGSTTTRADPYNLSEFKMGTRSKKDPVAEVPDFTNFQLGNQKAQKQKKIGFMGPLVDIIVHGGLGLPNHHKIRRHSYTPQPSADLLENVNGNSPKVRTPNQHVPQQQPSLSPIASEKRDLRKSAVDFVVPPPVDIEPSPKLFVATISKTRRMSLKDETAERLNELLSKQRTDQYKL